MGSFGQALCHEDLILTRKSHNCAGIAFIQGDSAGGSKLSEQTLYNLKEVFLGGGVTKIWGVATHSLLITENYRSEGGKSRHFWKALCIAFSKMPKLLP